MTIEVRVRSVEPDTLTGYVEEWNQENVLERIWAKDPTVWADPPVPEIANRLGWLGAPELSTDLIDIISTLHAEAVASGITDIVLCGMGGSSLAPEVFDATLPIDHQAPRLTVIDSTHPGAVRAVDAATQPATTWYIIASKSGGTIETMSLFAHFWEAAERVLDTPGRHFLAITDPATSLQDLATERGFRATVLADPDVGGRYSALTAFGLVPIGLTGRNIARLLESGRRAAVQCGKQTALADNPGFQVGILLAEKALRGDDKAQFLCSNPTDTIGIWAEQLIAESTGKAGLGIVPVDRGPRLKGDPHATVISVGATTRKECDIEITVDDPSDVAGAMFVLEFATAVAGRVLGINPFDQPDVQHAKKLAAAAMEGDLAVRGVAPIPVEDARWSDQVRAALAEGPPSYVSLQAYVPQDSANTGTLDEIRGVVTQLASVYTSLGFGPRFLHSTGQLHKGGPPGGLFLQFVEETGDPLDIPGTGSTFNVLISAQAAGDRAALSDAERTVIAIDLGSGGLSAVLNGLRSLLPDS